MALRPDVSITASLATAGLVYGVYQVSLPNITDVRAANSKDIHISGAERTATWIATGVVAAVSLIAKDPNIFVLGGGMVIAMAWHYRHANHVNPLTGLARSGINSADVASMPEHHDEAPEAAPVDEYAFA